MEVQAKFDTQTSTLTYVVYDAESKDAVIIDPLYNFDLGSAHLSTKSADELLFFIEQKSLNVHFLLETHVHADHISSVQYLKSKIEGAKIGIGVSIKKVQEIFIPQFGMEGDLTAEGLDFDCLFEDEVLIEAGTLSFQVIATPGHTPACVSYLFGKDLVFCGDALFMPDFGTGRCDFPGGDAKTLFHSVKKRLYELPDTTRVFVGHDYQPGGRGIEFETSIERQKRENIHIQSETREAEFVDFRTKRDSTLSAPQLLLPSLQVNMRAGKLPEADSKKRRFLKLPLTL